MPSVLFVCTANQFRSPLASALFSMRLNEKGKMNDWKVSSAGTWVKEEKGAHPIAILLADQLNLDLKNHVTREISNTMIKETDLIIVMSAGQKEALQFEFSEDKAKIVMLTELTGNGVSDIADPAMSDFENSNEVVADLSAEINKAFDKIISLVEKTN